MHHLTFSGGAIDIIMYKFFMKGLDIMSLLPQPTKGKFLKIEHFPTTFQALIFRLWEMVPASKLAEVLMTTEKNVLNAAFDMGLSTQKNLEQWSTRGYISILKAVWNLLPYEQILTLLDWDEDRLSFCLREDDFLEGKLGEKCDCSTVLYRALAEKEIIRTAKIKETVEKYLSPLDIFDVAKPFDFFTNHYKPIVSTVINKVKPDSSWCIECDINEVNDFITDFKSFAKKFGIEFKDKSDKKISIRMDIRTDDEEYHEVDITENEIKINAGSPLGVLRALYLIEDLAESSGSFTFVPKSYKRRTKLKTRFIYSFCGLYADVLDKPTEISFPDELLEGYARRGINGVWIQGVLYKLAPYPFDEKQSEGWEIRLENLNKLIKRAGRYGIKIYMYINEPRPLPISFFDNHPEWKGASLKDGYACLCSSHPVTHKYLKESIQTICKSVPLLGGFLNITQTENRVTCHSNGAINTPDDKACPVCKSISPSYVTSNIIKTMTDAVFEVNPSIKYFYFAWSLSHSIGEEEAKKVIESLPKNAILLQVSETEIPFEIGGVKDEILDYSLSIVGPGDVAKKQWNIAKENGIETAAKVQINNSWECSSAPFLPVYDNVVQHMKNLSEVGVEHIMLTWTLGGYISDNIKMASAYFFENKNSETDAYDDMLIQTYGEYALKVKEAVHHFCKGFSEYPFNWLHIYNGPSNAGTASLLYPEPTNMTATMTCFPYDDLWGTWRGKPANNPGGDEYLYPPEVLESQYRLLCIEWEKGLEIIKDMPECEFKDMAYYGYTLFKSSHNQIKYYLERDGGKDKTIMNEIVKSEKGLAILAYKIMLRNSAVGFEAANHYYVTRTNLKEKIVQCEYLLTL